MLRLILGAVFSAIFVTTSALAIDLTDGDFDYLNTQGIERASPVIRGLSPKESWGLHSLINDVRTKDDPAARSKAVGSILNEHREHQEWERMHPGELWDEPKREIFKR
jgi:hypothetical protein